MGCYITSQSKEARLCGARPDRFEIAVDLTPPLHQIIVHLQAEKEAFRQAEIAREPKVSVGSNISLAQHDLVDAARRDVNGTRQRVLAEAHRLEELFEQDFAGMWIEKQRAPRRGSRRFRHVTVLPFRRESPSS
jgi:hypothetical protein